MNNDLIEKKWDRSLTLTSVYSQLNEKGEINIARIHSIMKLARELNNRELGKQERGLFGDEYIYFI